MSSPLGLPRLNTLRRQFALALLALVLLTAAAGLLAVGALQSVSERTHDLAGESLVRSRVAREIERLAVFVERESERMVKANKVADLRASHAVLIENLDELDRLVDQLAAASDDVVVLSLHQSAQLFRNTVHVVASMHEGALRDALAPRRAAAPAPRHFDDELKEKALAVTVAANEVSREYTEAYRVAIEELAKQARHDQMQVLILLGGTLVLAWLVSHYFLGRRVIARLREVSHHLRLGDVGTGPASVPVHGSDEIAEMARAVEQFLEDRKQLAAANQALEAERRRQAELIEKLAQTQNQLLQSEKLAAIGQLAAGIAHEINNPVGFVNSNLGTLKRYLDDLLAAVAAYEAHERDMPEKCRAALAGVKQRLDLPFLREDAAVLIAESVAGLQRVTSIVQSLKEFSRVDETGLHWVNLEAGLDSTLAVLAHDLQGKVDVVRDFGGIPEVECVPSQINQVFMNLLVNAGQAIEAHGTITLRTAQAGDRVQIEISDSGSGIRPEHLKRIFDPFFTTRPVGKGTGLGLSLAYGIVRQHGGDIEVSSEPGHGSTFRVILPVRSAMAAEPAPQ